MEIERINENTIKFYISYGDLEERGFNHEDIWYNRDKSEELFWNMMEELNYEDQFNPDDPLWIQVQAMKKGLEVVVTKANLAKDGINLEFTAENDSDNKSPKEIEDDVEKQIEAILEEQVDAMNTKKADTDNLNFVLEIKELEDVIALSHQDKISGLHSNIYYYKERYYLEVEFDSQENAIDAIDDMLSVLLEYGDESEKSPHVMREYGKVIALENALETIKLNFER
ncbi:adaptor protein MecA [Brochothrix thermosphacta]|uniref:adaptor protein MecA n=1 Tax=Brochothrix thermosphacta TaxID=2756 RepID=UPI000EDBE63A|nr:adaptor protein MecA [Brochothrix thermosphacta]HCZ38063.1 adaptor protein MecA [Brochothrix thermosphacta]HCZ47196.1 adaptor protein MecA [Brochothrix thermosphacta]